MAKPYPSGAYLAALSCAVLPLRSAEAVEEQELHALLRRCFAVAAREHASQLEAAEAHKHALLGADLVRRRGWAEGGGHPAYPAEAFHEPEQWDEWREVEVSVCNRIRRRVALCGQFSGGTLMLTVQDVSCSPALLVGSSGLLRVRVECEGVVKATGGLAQGAQGDECPHMLGFPVTSLSSTLAVCVCAEKGDESRPEDTCPALASAVPLPVSDIASGDSGSEHSIWCQLFREHGGHGGGARAMFSMARKSMKGISKQMGISGSSGAGSSSSSDELGRVHLKLKLMDISSAAVGSLGGGSEGGGGGLGDASDHDPFGQMASLLLLAMRDELALNSTGSNGGGSRSPAAPVMVAPTTRPRVDNAGRQRREVILDDFPALSSTAAWLMAEFGYRHGVRRPHQRLLHLEALAAVAVAARSSEAPGGGAASNDSGGGGARHAPLLYKLVCAAGGDIFLTRTETDKYAQIVLRLGELAKAWITDFRRWGVHRDGSEGSGDSGAAGLGPEQLTSDHAGGITAAIVELVLYGVADADAYDRACAKLQECVAGAAARCYHRLVASCGTPLTANNLTSVVEAVDRELQADVESYEAAFPSAVPLRFASRQAFTQLLLDDTQDVLTAAAGRHELVPLPLLVRLKAVVLEFDDDMVVSGQQQQQDCRAELAKLRGTLAALFAPTLENWAVSAENTLERLLAQALDLGSGDEEACGGRGGGGGGGGGGRGTGAGAGAGAAVEALAHGCRQAVNALERLGPELLPRRVSIRLLHAVATTYTRYLTEYLQGPTTGSQEPTDEGSIDLSSFAETGSIEKDGGEVHSHTAAAGALLGKGSASFRSLKRAVKSGVGVVGASVGMGGQTINTLGCDVLDPESQPEAWATQVALINDVEATRASLESLVYVC
jgi:uncharacterized membrane protein YgcG